MGKDESGDLMRYESNYYGITSLGPSLVHHGIKGQKWGIRRFQYEDGSLTTAGKARYNEGGSMAEGMRYSSRRKKAMARKEAIGSFKSSASEKAGKAGEFLSKAGERNIKNGKDKPSISAMESITKNASSGVESASKLAKDVHSIREARKPKEPITMSDEELRKAINRLNMERQYRDLVNSQSTSSGYEYAQSVLSATGNVLGVVGAGLGIALTVKQLRDK